MNYGLLALLRLKLVGWRSDKIGRSGGGLRPPPRRGALFAYMVFPIWGSLFRSSGRNRMGSGKARAKRTIISFPSKRHSPCRRSYGADMVSSFFGHGDPVGVGVRPFFTPSLSLFTYELYRLFLLFSGSVGIRITARSLPNLRIAGRVGRVKRFRNGVFSCKLKSRKS